MNNCIDYESLIPEYLDGELDGSQLAEFEEHIKGCASCQKALEEARALFCDIRDCAEEVPSELKKRVMDEVNLRINAKNSRRSRFVRIAGSIAACFVVVIGIAFIIPHMDNSKSEGIIKAADGNTPLYSTSTNMNGVPEDQKDMIVDEDPSLKGEAPSEMEAEEEIAPDDLLEDDRGEANAGSAVPDGALPENYGESVGAADPEAPVGSVSDKTESADTEEEFTADEFNDYSTSVETTLSKEDLGVYFMTHGAAKLAELLEEMQ